MDNAISPLARVHSQYREISTLRRPDRNERISITSRIYPTRADSVGVALLTEHGEARLNALDAWQMRS
jgi:hypothetical protein